MENARLRAKERVSSKGFALLVAASQISFDHKILH
jgi:hypothetical protein